MISEGSCDTKDLSNGCWKFSFVNTVMHDIIEWIRIESSYFKLILFHNIAVFTVFYDQINAPLTPLINARQWTLFTRLWWRV